MKTFFFFLLFFSSILSFAQEPDWTLDAKIPFGGRGNPYNLSEHKLKEQIRAGQIHAQRYPVSVTGILLPEAPFKYILDNEEKDNPFKIIFNNLFKATANAKNFKGLFRWLGLSDYPKENDPEKFKIAYPEDKKPDYLLGYSRLEKNGATVFTMSCATCHSDQLFGQTILGMTKRFPRANDFFIRGNKALTFYNKSLFKYYTDASEEEAAILDRSVKNMASVGFRDPLVLGLDTSLAQVALSLNKREVDEWATKSRHYENRPRPDYLDHNPGDSKPAVWWNLKYKNRWLSDGSVISGNPIYTNILWNEVGRGTDLKELYQWLDENSDVIEELTTMTFSSEAPQIQDFFPVEKIKRASALRGEKLYNDSCKKCHGIYVKKWSLPEYQNSPWSEQIKTAKVYYHENTPVKDVGTDPYRRLSMKSLEQLNRLQISKDNGILIKAQEGYVPPPLVGIWARWPYMHNNSMPSLCAVLSPQSERPTYYYAGPPVDKEKDFDFNCNGYPLAKKTPKHWRKVSYYYNTKRKGLSNAGHEKVLFKDNGEKKFSNDDIHDLIQFLQTL